MWSQRSGSNRNTFTRYLQFALINVIKRLSSFLIAFVNARSRGAGENKLPIIESFRGSHAKQKACRDLPAAKMDGLAGDSYRSRLVLLHDLVNFQFWYRSSLETVAQLLNWFATTLETDKQNRNWFGLGNPNQFETDPDWEIISIWNGVGTHFSSRTSEAQIDVGSQFSRNDIPP